MMVSGPHYYFNYDWYSYFLRTVLDLFLGLNIKYTYEWMNPIWSLWIPLFCFRSRYTFQMFGIMWEKWESFDFKDISFRIAPICWGTTKKQSTRDGPAAAFAVATSSVARPGLFRERSFLALRLSQRRQAYAQSCNLNYLSSRHKSQWAILDSYILTLLFINKDSHLLSLWWSNRGSSQ